MASLKTLKKDDIVNFDMLRPGIFGDQYKGAVIASIGDFNVARLVDPDVAQKHASFYPFFKDKVDNVDNPAIYDYLILQLDKTKPNLIAIGFPWINEGSLKTITTRQAVVIIREFQEYHRAALTDFLEGMNVDYTLTIDDQ
ncbi:putative virion structural protein [Pseudomonas phage OBP]|uniref:putative virion structural protein n=1 Tax=Pseudomonas phage OBP TaxID=1124849 RepID=UPI000240D633|nr:putative virion structural protein [Pseudomonas phage OBP]AEV89491.1 putative virion structural protein [Pseudomonas phage OBP]